MNANLSMNLNKNDVENKAPELERHYTTTARASISHHSSSFIYPAQLELPHPSNRLLLSMGDRELKRRGDEDDAKSLNHLLPRELVGENKGALYRINHSRH